MARLEVTRGDVVLVAQGKPRPAVIVQADQFSTPVDVLICPVTTDRMDAPFYRLDVLPDANNGLRKASQLMIDKVGPARRDRIGGVIGRLDPADLERLDASLMIVLDLTGA